MEGNEEKIRFIIDTNILISALIKDDSYTAKLIKSRLFDVYYPEDGFKEIEFYKTYIISKREKSQQKWSFDYALYFIFEEVNLVPSELYSNKIGEAYEIMKEIDEKSRIKTTTLRCFCALQ